MTTHTPGPWHVGDGNGEGAIFSDTGRARLEPGGTALYPVCTVTTGYDATEDAGNARLIAAAPELAYLLRTILDVWDGHHIIGPTVYHDARAILRTIDGEVRP